MPAFRVSGATGQAPTTSWFGAYMPDNFTMAIPGHWEFATQLNAIDGYVPAKFISSWTPWNPVWRSGGSSGTSITLTTTTAPDGTMTADKLVEGTTNSFHMMVASFLAGFPRMRRLAVIAAAGERTRMVCTLSTAAGDTSEMGVHTVFDLAGGHIGVANASFGDNGFGNPPWTPGTTSISSLGTFAGKTWYLCIMEVTTQVNANGHAFYATIALDSGSGTGAISNSYAGNGTSGIYVWKSSILPPRAWGLNNVAFFDDFLSASTIDINNTLAPGFNWYLHNAWPLPNFWAPPDGPFAIPVPSSAITVTGSVMKNDGPSWMGSVPGAGESTVQSAAPLGSDPNGTPGGGFVGFTIQPSCLIEFRNSAPQNIANNQFNGIAYYTVALEALLNPNNDAINRSSPSFPLPYTEVDMPEVSVVDFNGGSLVALGGDEGGGGFNSACGVAVGYQSWYSLRTFGNGNPDVVFFNGQLYVCIVASSTGDQPDISPTKWSVFTPPNGQPTLANAVGFDNSQMHTNSFLWLSDNSRYVTNDFGEIVPFYNNTSGPIFPNTSAGSIVYGSNAPTPSNQTMTWVRADERHHVIHMSSSRTSSLSTDWVRIVK